VPLAGAQVLPIIVNKKEWSELPADLQAIVKAATAAHAQEQMSKSKLWESQAVADMEAKGLQWSPQPSEADLKAWKEAGMSLAKEYAAEDKYSKQLVDILEQQ
ncbi:C4-dicarboxylate ABC transporter substrate-binding protein, partial [Vibrio fluvialis]